MGAVLQQEQMMFQLTKEPDKEKMNEASKFFIDRMLYLPSMSSMDRRNYHHIMREKKNERLNT
jgi:hypothetical protein